MVDAINIYLKVSIKLYTCRGRLKETAANFKQKLWVTFDNCKECIYGVLNFPNKPNIRSLDEANLFTKKFYIVQSNPLD